MSALNDVKSGDELLLAGFGTRDEIVTIDRVTAKYIILKGGLNWMRFSKEDGCQSPRERMGNKHLFILTEKKRTEITARAQADYLADFSWHRLDPETLNELARFMHEHGFDAMPRAKEQKHLESCQCSECRWERAREHDKALKEQEGE
jgi:hypothetical protein